MLNYKLGLHKIDLIRLIADEANSSADLLEGITLGRVIQHMQWFSLHVACW
jgi:hypothetical protein